MEGVQTTPNNASDNERSTMNTMRALSCRPASTRYTMDVTDYYSHSLLALTDKAHQALPKKRDSGVTASPVTSARIRDISAPCDSRVPLMPLRWAI